jgi:hypothetical protein
MTVSVRHSKPYADSVNELFNKYSNDVLGKRDLLMPRIRVWKGLASSLGMGLAVLLLVGIPSGVIPNPYFVRPLDARPTDFLFLAIITALAVVLGATYGVPTTCSTQDTKAFGSGLLLFIGIGCPVCNKVVLALIGTSGALAYFEPIQPIFSVASIALMLVALVFRVRDIRRVAGTGQPLVAPSQTSQPPQ